VLDKLRFRLAAVDAVLLLSLLGLVSGVLAGAVIIALRLVIESVQAGFVPGHVENYEGLSAVTRVLLATGGGLLLGLVFQAVRTPYRHVGMVHVMERLAYHQGHLPLGNTVMQFFGAAASIVCGHSVGREGPGIHLGSASGSLLGQWLELPNNSIRTLVACGCAAAIAASFNTPIAGVIFAMEVVMMEYTLYGFAPVILAAVSATSLTRAFFGSEPAFSVPQLELASLLEMPYVVVMGLVSGALAALFISLLKFFSRLGSAWPVWLRITLGGCLAGLVALPVPAVMGIGYDTVNSAMLGQMSFVLLLLVVAGKLLATTAGLGLGIPGGLIGPTLVIGAAGGGAMGILAESVFPGDVASAGFYAMIGMGAMMAATLQAPLAALMAMLELTANPNIILPGMLAVITASLTCSELFNKPPVFVMLLRTRGLDYHNDPVAQSLRRQGVANVMNRSFVIRPTYIQRADALDLVSRDHIWLVIEAVDSEHAHSYTMLRIRDLARFLEAETDMEATTEINLAAIPAERLDLAPLRLQATLQEAVEQIARPGIEALYVYSGKTVSKRTIYGVLTRKDIDEAPLT